VSIVISRFPVILASGSPRRRELLSSLFENFQVIEPNLDESSDIVPLDMRAAALAKAKADAVKDGVSLIIAADTIVELDQLAHGKPTSNESAFAMLSHLSGRTHSVITGVCLLWPEGEHTFVDKAHVTFKQLAADEISEYIATGEPMDKAGAYAVQGLGKRLIDRVQGDRETVVGLPVRRLREKLAALGLIE
jgi:septum formation protein